MKEKFEEIALATAMSGAAISIITRLGLGDDWLKYGAAAAIITAGVFTASEFKGGNRFLTPVLLALSFAGAGYIEAGWKGALIGGVTGAAASQMTRVPLIARLFKQA